MEPRPRQLLYYRDENDYAPCHVWLDQLRDSKGRAVVRIRLNRLSAGNFGDSRSVGDGVFEIRIDFGPGYRIYFGIDGDSIILLAGGDKRSQKSDIGEAKIRWRDYNA